MFRARLRYSLAHVGQALHEPEEFAVRWHREGAPYAWGVFLALALTAIAGTTLYGLVIGMADGSRAAGLAGLRMTASAGIAWGLPLPALYVLNSLTGSRLRISTTFLAALVTTSWGGLALIAALPIALFFTAAIPSEALLLLVHLVIFGLVGVAMVDVFGRVMARLEPDRGWAPAWWLVLVGAIGCELFHAFGLFHLAVVIQFLP